MTIKLYDEDCYASEFEAVVLSCEKCEKGYKTVLDQTLFFPEEGGQCADKGTLDLKEITDVQLSGDTIYHYSIAPFEAGSKVMGKIDFELRFSNMQNHSGEHILSGLAHRIFGYENVGFHLGLDSVTMDLSGEITKDDVNMLEALANEAVYKNMPVKTWYPEKAELDTLECRSKGNIEGAVRVVKIGDVDMCACCAPHVNFTGEIGIIKILNAIRYKGGTRLSILCGKRALNDYREKHNETAKISSLISCPQPKIAEGVEKLLSDMASLKARLGEKNKIIIKSITDSIEPTDNNICLFCEDTDSNHLREIANDVKSKTSKLAVVLSGNDSEGFRYVIASKDTDVASFTKDANQNLNGRGGGKGTMSSGTFNADMETIKKYFE